MALFANNRRLSPNDPTLSLQSNNPFRNRAPSPSAPVGAPSSLQTTQQARMSRNPFLDASEIPAAAPATKSNVSGGLTEDMFVRVTLPYLLLGRSALCLQSTMRAPAGL
ncbi:hypothetical protein LTR74_017980 [Friedmanniomyces endolithicus]|nr:hypothetical protein LTR74_017980 [Friedmanniomyces endolithicus]